MELLMNPQVWVGLLTPAVLEIVLGIDNLASIAILVDKLSPKQRDKARLTGLSLALIMRLGLLSVISWMMMLAKPLFTIMDYAFPGRDLIMLLRSIFLLFKATTELHEWLENREHDTGQTKGYTNFRVIITQVIILDAVFSLDAMTTAVDMINHLPVTMAVVVTAMAVMLLTSKLLTRSVNQHPTVVVLYLSSLLMIGLSLVVEGFGSHTPRGYLYAAISFSVIIELFNQITRRNSICHQSTLPLHARTADVILHLIGGKCQVSVQMESDSLISVPIPEGTFVEEEHYMINGALFLASRSLRGTMTPRGEISWVDADLSVAGIREQLLSLPHSLFPMCRDELDEIIDVVRAKELLVALEDDVDVVAIAFVSPAITVPETLDPINLLGVLRRARGSLVIITSEFGVVQGLITPLDVSEAIASEFLDVDKTPEVIVDADGRLAEGGADLHVLQQALDAGTLMNEDEDIAMVASLVIAANDHIPCVGDAIEVAPLSMTIIETNDYRVDLVRIVKKQPTHGEGE